MKKFLCEQYNQDKKLIEKPREVLFVGKGNVGKSSLINEILNIDAARTSKNPGCTKHFNFYGTNIQNGKIVDGPSYGFHTVSSKSQHKYKKLLKNYITFSSRICKLFWCINTSQGFSEMDRVFFNFIKSLNLPIQLVLTKIDLVPHDLLYAKILAITQPFKIYNDIVSPYVIMTSVKSKIGLDELAKSVKQSLLESPTRSIFYKAGKVTYLNDQIEGDVDYNNFKLLSFENEENDLLEDPGLLLLK
jgi:GTP-binding protein